ncbi:MAG: DUF2911 domain-containing protein [Rhodothermales bacterium]
MRKTFFNSLTGLLALVLIVLAAQPANAQRDNSKPRPSPNASVSQTIGTTVINVEYGRPGVKGRQIFGGLEAYGKVWRAGANEPTTLTFENDIMVEGQHLVAGTYNLFFRLAENGEWGAIFAKPVRWGTMYDEANKVLEVKVKAETIPNQEWLSYTFENVSEKSATLVMKWETKMVGINIGTM